MGARFYDASLGRWHVVDPLAEVYYSQSTYHFSDNNPLFFIDANGMSYSPYFDINGNFLGVDENEFSGEIYITDQKTFDKYKDEDGKVVSTEIQDDQSTIFLGDVQNIEFESLSKIYSTTIKKINGISVDDLHNDRISIYSGKGDPSTGKPLGYNDPARTFTAKTTDGLNGTIKVSVHKDRYRSVLNTVENIQSELGVHEYYSHGVKGWAGSFSNPEAGTHWKCYYAQIKHRATFENLNKDYRNHILRQFQNHLYIENRTLYNKIYGTK